MRLRKVQGKLKVEHSILDGLRNVLERLLDNNPSAIRSIIPGVIRPVRDAKGEVRIRVTVPTTNGWKAIALSAGARQELFISTNLSKDQLEQAIRQASGAGTKAYEVLRQFTSRTRCHSCSGRLAKLLTISTTLTLRAFPADEEI